MIDIHSHLLPYLDDGATDWNEALQMARQAAEDGIRIIVATPHHANGRYHNPGQVVKQAVADLNQKIQELNLELLVLPGQEVRVYDNLLEDLNSGEGLLPLNESRYLLIELPSTSVPKNMDELIFELSIKGYQAVIAHPERNSEIAGNPKILEQLVDSGALGQLTAQSVAGHHGRKLQKLSIDLCRRNLVHLIATDAHDLKYRPFRLAEAYQFIQKELGLEIEQYFKDNAKKIVSNLPISSVERNVQHPVRRNRVSKILSIFNH